MLRRYYLASLLLVLLYLGIATPTSAASQDQPKDYRASAFNQDIVVQKDGSLLVTEQITIRFTGGPFTTFTRAFTDNPAAIDTLQQVGMDHQDGGEPADTIEVSHTRRSVGVTWTFRPLSNVSQKFLLSYRVSGAVQQMSDSDLLQWIAVPTEHPYRIDSAIVHIHYPDQARLLSTPQEMQGRKTQITPGSHETIFVGKDLAPNEYTQFQLLFAPGSVIPQDPWLLQQRHLLPYLIVPCLLGGMLLFAIGWWLLALRARKYRRPLPAGSQPWTSVKAPPDKLSPAMAGILARNMPDGSLWNQFLATVFDLTNRHILTFQETEHAYSWQKEPDRQYWLELLSQPDDLLPHEQALLKVLFKSSKQASETRIKVHNIRGRYNMHKLQFDNVLQQMIQQENWFDPQRRQQRHFYAYSTATLIILGGIGIILTIILMARITPYYGCLFLLDGPILTLALVAGTYYSKHSLVQDKYWPLAWEWQQFSAYLRQVSSAGAILTNNQAAQIDGYLPYAASFGLAQSWLAHFYEPTKNSLPDWFSTQIHDPQQQHSAFMNMLYNSQLIPTPKKRTTTNPYAP
ncbi:hypothetical protein KDA_43880 [Dictyobacter alpinus]|uniref:DUF2207 domain-containing protein n=1 Tax=Dictyobacter alpinus TaxID=2014873 RepID=A0A402BC42_9CHLR|nr:DUF2207 domain-containing protein [Dictyobacter alpinus]GCE28904.1 hypothetical protein KDA_43880 [Dictyobacter alpinus]